MCLKRTNTTSLTETAQSSLLGMASRSGADDSTDLPFSQCGEVSCAFMMAVLLTKLASREVRAFKTDENKIKQRASNH